VTKMHIVQDGGRALYWPQLGSGFVWLSRNILLTAKA